MPKENQSELGENTEFKDKISETNHPIEYFAKAEVDYDRSVDDFLKEGNYKHVSPNMGKVVFPERKSEGKKAVAFKLFSFDESLTSEEAEREMKSAGYRPATIEELMSFGEINPDIQRSLPINSLDTVVNHPETEKPSVFQIWSYTGKPIITFENAERDWDRYSRFLGVKIEGDAVPESDDLEAKTTEPSRELEYVSRIMVDYDISIDDAISGGLYEWENPNVRRVKFGESEKGKGEKEVAFKIFSFTDATSSKEAAEAIDEAGYRPATFRELNAFAKINPDIQRYFPINALGTVEKHPQDDSPMVFEIWTDHNKRRVSMNNAERNWDRYCRFLAVKKED